MSIYTEFVSILIEPVMKEILLLGEKKDCKLRIQNP